MDAAIGPATSEEIGHFYGRVSEFTVMRLEGRAVAIGGARQIGDRTWVTFDLAEDGYPYIGRIIRALRAHLRERNETVYCICNASDFPKAGRLLSILGFAPTEELAIGGKRIWRWCARPPRYQDLYPALNGAE